MNAALDAAYRHCEAETRAHERDRWLAGLFVPPDARRHIYALTAFSHEISRLRDVVREPLAGEMRLQWWREALGGERAGEAAANPIAAATADTMARFGLPFAAFDAMIAAHASDLYADAPPTLSDLEGYCGETSSALFQLAAIVLARAQNSGAAEVSGHAGVAFAVAQRLRALPRDSVRGQCFVPADILEAHGVAASDVVAQRDTPGLRGALAQMRGVAQNHFHIARALLGALRAEIRPAFLPLFLVPLYLGSLEARAAAPFAPPPEIPQWRRQWTLWRSAQTL